WRTREQKASTPGARLGVQDSMGISTLEPGQKPPSSPPGKLTPIKVQLLDEAQEVYEVSLRAPGKFLLDLICQNLNLVESDYFALEFLDHRKVMVWLDLLKPIANQVRRPKHVVMRFVVKFFPPDHAQLQEELTRYLFALQIKQDLASGRMICNEMSMALLVSHIIQSEIGDFDESLDQEHLEKNKYMPQQDTLEDKIMEFHRRHVGQTPAESDFQLLEIARRLETYGIRQHPAKDREGTKIHLSVSHTGIIVFQGQNKINSFNWAKVRKLSFKRKRFLIKFRPEVNSCQDTLEFSMNNRDSCKAFWKICVEYHAFFRLIEEPKPKPKPILFSRGSSFRFSGRTQKQLLDYVKEGGHKRTQFESNQDRVERRSRSPKRSPKEDRREAVLMEEPGRDKVQQPNPQREQQNAGPASKAARGSSSSIPYIDCSDVDSREYDLIKGQIIRSQSQTNDNYEDECVSGEYFVERNENLNQLRNRDLPSFTLADAPLHITEEFSNLSFYSGRSPRMTRHSSLVDEIFRDSETRNPLATPVHCSSKVSSPVTSFNRHGYQGFILQNGHCNRRLENKDSHVYSHKDCNSFSPILSRPHSQRVQSMRNRSETDPFILSQIASSPSNDYRSGTPFKVNSPRILQSERRLVGNGLSAAGQTKPSPPVHRMLAAGCVEHPGGAQLLDASTSSGTESSDSDSEVINPFSPPLTFGNPIAVNSSPMPRNKFSFGSLQLDEMEEEEGSISFSDPDDGSPVSEHGVITC
uniref:FERM, ARH/RhoGEF and pleckstrin domain protein 1 n=1 Tax=Callorhinchus milii TaxID=7868 RepID=A0A4W3H926_CALMI